MNRPHLWIFLLSFSACQATSFVVTPTVTPVTGGYTYAYSVSLTPSDGEQIFEFDLTGLADLSRIPRWWGSPPTGPVRPMLRMASSIGFPTIPATISPDPHWRAFRSSARLGREPFRSTSNLRTAAEIPCLPSIAPLPDLPRRRSRERSCWFPVLPPCCGSAAAGES